MALLRRHGMICALCEKPGARFQVVFRDAPGARFYCHAECSDELSARLLNEFREIWDKPWSKVSEEENAS